MELFNIRGRKTYKNISKYRIKWTKPSRSQLQTKFKELLKKYWIGHKVYEEFPVYGSQQKVDFMNFTLNIAVEVNGEQHDKFVKHFHKNKNGFIDSLRRDRLKSEWLEANDFKLIELIESDLKVFSPKYIKDLYGIDIK